LLEKERERGRAREKDRGNKKSCGVSYGDYGGVRVYIQTLLPLQRGDTIQHSCCGLLDDTRTDVMQAQAHTLLETLSHAFTDMHTHANTQAHTQTHTHTNTHRPTSTYWLSWD